MGFTTRDIKSVIDDLSKAMIEMKRVFDSSWNDEVHTSFQDFIQVCDDNVRKLNDIFEKIEKECQEINKFNIENSLKQSKEIAENGIEISKCADELSRRNI